MQADEPGEAAVLDGAAVGVKIGVAQLRLEADGAAAARRLGPRRRVDHVDEGGVVAAQPPPSGRTLETRKRRIERCRPQQQQQQQMVKRCHSR